jgi:hypothetical protein
LLLTLAAGLRPFPLTSLLLLEVVAVALLGQAVVVAVQEDIELLLVLQAVGHLPSLL